MRSVLLVILIFLTAGVRYAIADICVNDRLTVSDVRGRVVAAWRGGVSPIPGASIKLREYRNDEWQTKAKVTGDENGVFSFGGVPSGEYELYVAASAFRSFGTRVRVKGKAKPAPGREIVVNLEPLGCGSAVLRKAEKQR
ncbi:MAG: carboxypeptidase-like regulatory domain-containing protein [Acidobacteriota bacterium]|nr:carboxypeptidase-like regulatory domain-containing protein [Acidobacteriota bacterium]